MKKLLIIPMLFACYMVMGQDAAKIIGKPYQLNNIEVARNDFPNMQNWNDAIAKCNKLGEGWRLPTSDELKRLFWKQKEIGGFKDSLFDSEYWSSTDVNSYQAWNAKFQDGYFVIAGKDNLFYVRAVRSL